MLNHAKSMCRVLAAVACLGLGTGSAFAETNPIIKDVFTADPAAIVYKDTVYLYTGHDEAKGNEMFTMKDWLCYSSKDMKTWKSEGSIMKATDFKWATKDAWATQVVEKGGKFYFYVTAQHAEARGGKSIGVAVADSPTGPFVDARGSALITDDMTPSPNNWDDIDPTIFIDDDGTPWLAWGNPNCYLVKLKKNMTELDGEIQKLNFPNYTEAPWLYKHGKTYYMVYASFAHQGMGEKVCYATASKVTGPWKYQGILTEGAKNSYTIHPAVLNFKGQDYLLYHNATLTLNGETGAIGRRAVCVDYLYYNPDGTIQTVIQTVEGVDAAPKKPEAPAKKSEEKAVSDAGVKLVENTAPGATSWPGKPVFVTADNPWNSVIMDGVSFNDRGGAESLGQSFTVDADSTTKRITLYAGDGFGTDTKNPLSIALYDLGATTEIPAKYGAEGNLLGGGSGMKIAYEPQASGLLHFDFKDKIALKAGHTYVFELQSARGAVPIVWRRTKSDTYPKGGAYKNRTLIDERGAKPDFVLGVYIDSGK